MDEAMKEYQWDLEKHGDLLEHQAFQFVRDNIPAYERIWASYIGHSGNGYPSMLLSNGEILDAKHSLSVKRQELAQYHYTILEALYSLVNIHPNPEGQEYLQYASSFLQVSDQLILFHAQLGRVRDCLKECLKKIGMSRSQEDNEDLERLYDPRCVVMHGPRIPLSWGVTFQEYFIIEPSSKMDGAWDDAHSLWTDEVDTKFLIPLKDYYSQKKELAIGVSRRWLEKIYSGVKGYMKSNGLEIYHPLSEDYHAERPSSGGFPKSSWETSSVFNVPASGSMTSVESIIVPTSSPVLRYKDGL